MKKILPSLKLTLLVSLLSFKILAQKQTEKCGTSILHNELLNDPAYLKKMDDFEKYVKTQNISQTPKVAAQYRIPVVVHVLHKGEAIGTGTNVSDADIRQAIKDLNNRYRKTAGTAGAGNGVDMEIEFALAVRNPSGACTNGITRVSMTNNSAYMNYGVKVSGANGLTDAQTKAITSWDRTKYYNIYLVSEIDDNEGGAGIQGYAYFASSHGTSQDGAVILASNFTSGASTTATHELGHALNLYHTFEGDGSGTTCPTQTNGCGSGLGDCCADTPPHMRSASDCNTTGTNSCNNNSSNTLFVRNYMDYSADDCMNMFTANQKTRALAACSGPRASFFASSNLALTPVSAPVANFSTSASLICSGQTVTFTDLSACVPNTYLPETNWSNMTFNWTFTNGSTVLTSTLQNPTMTFTVAGAYDVTLSVTTSAGSNSITKPAHVVLIGTPVAACTPTSPNSGNYAQTVSKVVFNTIDNASDDYLNIPYSNYICSANTILQEGTTYPLSITANAGPSGAENFEVYIDYDNNGVFANPSEMVHSGSVPIGSNTSVNTQTLTANVTIPSTAVKNTPLRMRVIADASAITANKRSCSAQFFIGDVEDYGIYIQSLCTAAPTISTQPSAATICANANTTFSTTSTGGNTFQWQVSTDGGTNWSNVSGTVYSNATTATLTITGATSTMNNYKYKCIITNNCGSTTSSTAQLTVNAAPTIAATTPASRCGAGTVNLGATSSGTLSWFTAANGGTSLGTGSTFTTPSISTSTTYYVQATSNGCSSTRSAVLATVNPAPTMTTPTNQSVCSGQASTAVTFSGSTGNTYAWTNNNAAIGLAASGSGNIPSFTSSGSGVATISVTPTLNNCVGNPITFTITVNVAPTVTATTPASRCGAGSVNLGATSSGTLSWFAAANGGTSLGTGSTFTTPSISTSTTYYVQATSNGCSSTRSAVLATVNPTPTMTTPTNQSVCSGQASTAVTFSGSTGNTYAWTNNNSAIGLAASGSGNIPSFTSSGSGVATISVTPTLNNCVGNPISFTITVNAAPTVNNVNSQTLCANQQTAAINFSGSGTTYNWTNNNNAIGLATSGTGNISGFSALNSGTSPLTATLTVTPAIGNCIGANKTFTITVNPIPTMTTPANQSFCLGVTTSAVNFIGTNGSTFNWTNNNSAIGLNSAGVGNIGSFTPSAVGNATISVTPNLNSCAGTPVSFVIAVTNCSADLKETDDDVIVIYPNPTSGLLTIKGEALKTFNKLELIDGSGRLVGEWNLNINLLNLDLSAYPTGNYNLKLSGTDVTKLKKIQIKR